MKAKWCMACKIVIPDGHKRCPTCGSVIIQDAVSSVKELQNKKGTRWLTLQQLGWWFRKDSEVTTLLLITLALLLGGCSPGQHHGHIYIHDPNHIEVQFDRPMSMSVDRDGVKVEASSMQPGFFEDIIKFLLLRPR